MVKALSANRGGFLLSANLEATHERVGRRKRQREKANQRAQQVELEAEKRPRTQNQWLEAERKKTQLPAAAGGRADDKWSADAKDTKSSKASKLDLDDDGPIGRKKAKRMAVLEKKKAQQASKKALKDKKAHNEAVEAVKGKAKAGELAQAASDLLKRCRRDPTGEQRLIALVAERVAGEPEKELELFDIFFELHATGSDLRTKQLALLSAVAIFKDLVPGYKIREPTEQEKAAARSKAVLAVEKHELGLLQTYRRLLPALEAAMKRDAGTFAYALAALVKAASDFNYRQRLIGTAVKYANNPDETVRRAVSEGVQEMVEADRRLESSKEVVLAVGHIAQGAAAGRGAGSLQVELLQILLRLQVGRSEDAALQEAAADYQGADEDVKRGLAEASISQGSEQLRKAEAELLYEVFCVYLRILRQRHIHSRELVASALVGLARWGQQVNLELLLEILTELRQSVQDAINQTDELVALQGLNCALVLLSGPSQALLTDATWLPDALTRALALALPSLHATHSESAAWPPRGCYELADGKHVRASRKELAHTLEAESVPCLVLRVLDNAMRCPHGFGRASDAALASLLETLFLLAMGADSHVGLALLREASVLLKKHRRLHTLLDAEGGLFGLGGVTDRAVTIAWHLQPLACSLSPAPARVGKGLAETLRSRRALLSDLFPSREGRPWLEWEFPQHLAALSEVPTPDKASKAPNGAWLRASKPAAFVLSDAELRTRLGMSNMDV